MRSTWLEILDCVLRPARPALERCLLERERHLGVSRLAAERRAQVVAECEQRITDARQAVFAADDGVVGAQMTALEREWRRLSRQDPEAGLMDLWAQLVPACALDRKRWRDAGPERGLDAALALAADVDGVDAAERAALRLRALLAESGVELGARLRWRFFERDTERVVPLLAHALRVASGACSARERARIFERAGELEASVLSAAAERLAARPALARDLAHAARVDFLWRAAGLAPGNNPTDPLATLWRAGYHLADVDSTSIALELPQL